MRMVAKERIANEREKGKKRVGQNSRGRGIKRAGKRKKKASSVGVSA